MGTGNSKEDTEGSSNAQGISFEVILSPKVENATIPELTPRRTGLATRQAIDEKLEAADRRRKNKEDEMVQKLASEEEHVNEVRQAMSEYKERKRRETESRYQRRLFIFADNQESIANERAEKCEENTRRIEAARKAVQTREKSFRETIKEKLSEKLERFKDHHSKYHVSRREAARLKDEKVDAVRSSKERQIEERATATAEKIRRKAMISQELREASVNEKRAKIQEKQAKVQGTKEALERSMEVSSCKKLMDVNERLELSAKRRQDHEREVQEKAKADSEKVKEVKKLREERERRFSDCTRENLQMKFKKAEELLQEKNEALRQQALQEKTEREQKVKNAADQSEVLREKIEEKMQRWEENRTAVLNTKVEQCQKEIAKVGNTKENAKEQIRNHEKATEEKVQAKLDTYRENRLQRLIERKEKRKEEPNKDERPSLQEITNGEAKKISPKKEGVLSEKISMDLVYGDGNTENVKISELAENFRNRNLEYLGLI